jgi:hypothetical protein
MTRTSGLRALMRVAAAFLACAGAAAAAPAHRPDEAGMQLVTLAVRHAIDSVDEGGPLIPFVITQRADGKLTIARVIVGPATAIEWAASASKAREMVAHCGGVRCVAAVESPPQGGAMTAMIAILRVPAQNRTFAFIQPFSEGSATAKTRPYGALRPISATRTPG